MNQKTIAVTAVLAAAVLTGIFATSPLTVYAQGEDFENEEEAFDVTDDVAEDAADEAEDAADEAKDAAEDAGDAAEDAGDEGNFLTFGSFDPDQGLTSALVDENEDAEDENEDFEEDAEDFEEEMDN